MNDLKFVNPLYDGSDSGYTNYEIQSVRDYTDVIGNTFVEPCEPDDDDSSGTASSPVYYAVYGHMKVGGVEHLFDRDTEAAAVGTLRQMGVRE